MSEAEIDDVQSALGIDRSAAILRAELQQKARLIRPSAREHDPGYHSISIDDDTMTLVYRSANPSSAQSVLNENASISANIRLIEHNVSENELELGLISIKSALSSLSLQEGTPAFWVDKQTDQIVVEATENSVSLLKGELDGLDTVDYRIDELPLSQLAKESATLHGGVSASTCTWGFTVIDGGVRRMVTAGHCSNTQTYGGGISMPFTGDEANSGNVDAQIHDHAAGNYASNSIVVGNGVYRTITSRSTWSAMDVGDSVCHRGKATGWSCGTITSVTGAQWSGGGTHVLRASGPYLKASSGDSGGPVVSGNAALGLGEGYSGSPPNLVMIFTAISFAESHFGMTVATS